MSEDKEDAPYRSPISEAKDAFMVLMGVDRDGDVETGKKLASKIKEKLGKYNESTKNMIKRYFSNEPGQGEFSELDEEEINDLINKYDLP
jgi:hypothetical protein